MKFIILLFIVYAIIQSYSCCVVAGRADRWSEKYEEMRGETKDGQEL